LNLSRALGDLEYKNNNSLKAEDQMITAKPDVKKIGLSNVDFVIIGCDGIWECKTNE
jgi:protein phosphatase 1G